MKRAFSISAVRGIRAVIGLAALVGALAIAGGASAAPLVTGAIFTTDSQCQIVNFNVGYLNNEDVYLNGGPQNPNHGGGLP